MTLEDANAVVIVFTLKGCGHCEEFRPHLDAVVRDHPDVVVVRIDGADPTPGAAHQVRRFNVTAYPTVVLARRNGGYAKHEGAPSAEVITQIFRRARAAQQGRT